MSLFNDKHKHSQNDRLSLDDFEKRIDERKEELNKLNDILRGMRAEVSNLMDEIKKLTDELVKKNAEKFLLDQKVEDLDRDYHILLQNVEEQQSISLSLRRDSEQLKDEIKSSMIIQDELAKLKTEFNEISKQLESKKAELLKIDEENNQTQSLETVQIIEVAPIENNTKEQKKCAAKTKNGKQCKRVAIGNSKFCKQHSYLGKR
jgi:chromosome segregation ATPase